MVKELFYDYEEVTFHHDGIVLKKYDEIRDGYNFKIIANVAVVDDDDGLRVFGAVADDDDGNGTSLYCNENQLVGFTDKPIEIHVVGDDFRLPEDIVISSGYDPDDDSVEDWALVLYEPEPVIYVNYNNFNESTYKEVIEVIESYITSKE